VTSVAVWINLLDLGIGNSLTNLVSHAYARGERSEAVRAITNALALTSTAALLAGFGFVLMWRRVIWTSVFNASPHFAGEIRWTVLVAGALMIGGLPINLVGKILAGFQELHTYNKAVLAGTVGSLAGLVVGVSFGLAMPVLFLLSFGSVSAICSITLIWLVTWHKPWLMPKRKFLDRQTAVRLLNTGWSFLLIQTAAFVVFSSDNIVVSHYLGAAEMTPYSVTWKFVGTGAILQSLLFPALWPAYAEAYARSDAAWIRRTFTGTVRGVIVLNLAYATALAIFGRTLIRWWAGAAAVPPYPLLIAMACWSIISCVMSLESCLLGALNRTRTQAVLSIVAAALNVLVSITLVTRIGALGVILGTIISYIVVLIGPQTLMVTNALRELSPPETTAVNVPAVATSEAAS